MNRFRKVEPKLSPSPSRMLAWLTARRDRRRTARELYGSIVTQARQPVFYADWGVADALQGRFEMIVLHLALMLQRLAAEGDPGKRLGRALTESFVVDMDDAMREMTFGDLAVPREIKHAVAALYDRHNAYIAALASPEPAALEAVLGQQMAYLGSSERLDAAALARYMRHAVGALAQLSGPQVLAGRFEWPALASPPGGAALDR
jgi:cytochrome b pre-mRNA-processing protein 3